ncbi:MAG: SH3 domain-containing protein, partial [Gammaproteobacteria bacterium]
MSTVVRLTPPVLTTTLKFAWILVLALFSVPVTSIADVVVTRESVEKYVNIRAAANASSEVIGELHRGKQVEFVGTVLRWHEVTIADGRKGFVSSVWTKVVAADVSGSVDEAEVVEEVTAANETLDQPAAAEEVSVAIETPDEPEVAQDAPVATETFSEPTVAEVAPEVSESAPQANQL